MSTAKKSDAPDEGERLTAHRMTREDWRAEQERNLKRLERRILFPPDNYQTLSKSY